MSVRVQVFGLLLFTMVSTLVHAQATRTVRDGVYSDAQAARGATLYGQQCASCHGDKLEGVQGPPLTTDVFLGRWQAQPLSDLANKIRNTMPAGNPGTLTPQQSTDLVAHILKDRQLPVWCFRTGVGRRRVVSNRLAERSCHRRCANGTRPRVSAAREHGAVDARHLLPERESDLHGANTRSCREAPAGCRRRSDGWLLVRRMGSRDLWRMGAGGQRRNCAG